ncbi:MAG: metallophosphoesterase family protein [Planctomycetes bacterium]|nr:metallophosphoesterase family protein [Planctomycetota bacterium]
MRLGLITDIHEHVENLQAALDALRAENVDQIVMIGDVVAMTDRLEETCRLLADAQVIGVWGNHDYGLCRHVTDELRGRYSSTVIDYMATLQPRLEIDGCLFMHVEPWLDPESLADLWYFEGPLSVHGNVARIFAAVPHRRIFAGHYHRWLLARPEGLDDWNGQSPIQLNADRSFVVVGALCEGHFATLDTTTGWLSPVQLPRPAG